MCPCILIASCYPGEAPETVRDFVPSNETRHRARRRTQPPHRSGDLGLLHYGSVKSKVDQPRTRGLLSHIALQRRLLWTSIE